MTQVLVQLASYSLWLMDQHRLQGHSRDERRTTQNRGICSPGGKDGEMYYEEDPDVIHFDNSSDLPLSTSLSDLDNATLHIDGQSTEVDAPPDIIDLDEDDDIIDDEDLVNVDDDDGVEAMSVDVARGHGGDGGGDDRPPPHQIPTDCGGCLGNRGHPKIKFGLVPIRFEWNDRETLMPLDDHAAHWANYLGELVRELPMHYPSWRQVSAERKAGVLAKIGNQFDLKPHMESERWTKIHTGIQQHLQKIYNGNKAALKNKHRVQNPETGTYD
ncbi:hypothetical protein Tco_1232521, partial [Tanacetum coccineum]